MLSFNSSKTIILLKQNVEYGRKINRSLSLDSTSSIAVEFDNLEIGTNYTLLKKKKKKKKMMKKKKKKKKKKKRFNGSKRELSRAYKS